MQFPANANQYLTTEVFTAPPQKLQLMLIETAIRLIARAKQHWRDKEMGEACLALLDAQQIVDQLIAGVNREVSPDLADRVLGVYDFLARRLRESAADCDEKKLDDTARVLEIERGTWKMVCDELSGKIADAPAESPSAASNNPPPAPLFDSFGDLTATGFSLEA
jgi:flagellar secretion chaperone FliS